MDTKTLIARGFTQTNRYEVDEITLTGRAEELVCYTVWTEQGSFLLFRFPKDTKRPVCVSRQKNGRGILVILETGPIFYSTKRIDDDDIDFFMDSHFHFRENV